MNIQRGFTLIEVMVTVAIISILAAVAVPAYSDYVVRGRIPDATSFLSSRQVELEQYFQDNRTYAGSTACTTDTSTSQYFDFSCSGVTASTFTLRADGKGAMTGFAYTINEFNQKTTAAVPSGWSAHSPNNCWVTKKGGAC